MEIADPKKSKNILFLSSKQRKIKVWNKSEDQKLLRIASEHNFKNWKLIARLMGGRTAIQCAGRYKRIRPGIVKGAWTKEEDELLFSLVSEHGKNWALISTYITTKNGKQIRDRFVNKLDKNLVRERFSPEDDDKLFELYSKFGRSWTKISTYFPGRTGDMIKNRFYSNIRKRMNQIKNNYYSKAKDSFQLENQDANCNTEGKSEKSLLRNTGSEGLDEEKFDSNEDLDCVKSRNFMSQPEIVQKPLTVNNGFENTSINDPLMLNYFANIYAQNLAQIQLNNYNLQNYGYLNSVNFLGIMNYNEIARNYLLQSLAYGQTQNLFGKTPNNVFF